ncbi:helix-turn-helix transcriptional regulator [Thalassotalea euphylliae]|uniref:AraC family transcriptional regulator n=1 Tax=Thalassotalea euphylliae TaxID=1655234 RepID=A0A3E0UCD6_9GAMM|nr:AraC family transcriptional regulator [Thalassotalea euphylliae]REL34658.1 AraC family transcriptional regulator [Thalassotalea euphylliae]
MKSKLAFFQATNEQLSDCGQVLDIELSSEALGWQGVILEKGSSPHFYPQNVYTPYFYFALALEEELHWQAGDQHNEITLKTTPGNIWINPPKTPFTHDISEPCYFVILAVEASTFLNSCPLNIDSKKLSFLNNYNVIDETIKGIIELFLLEVTAQGRNGKVYLNQLIALLSTHYIQHYSNYFDLQNSQQRISKFEQRQVDKVTSYIQTHIGEAVTVGDLAELLNCSKFYFLREFKKFTGLTPYQYLMNERLSKAKAMLTQPNARIAEIASALGFNDQAHFTRTFKSHFGVPPGQFNKSD